MLEATTFLIIIARHTHIFVQVWPCCPFSFLSFFILCLLVLHTHHACVYHRHVTTSSTMVNRSHHHSTHQTPFVTSFHHHVQLCSQITFSFCIHHLHFLHPVNNIVGIHHSYGMMDDTTYNFAVFFYWLSYIYIYISITTTSWNLFSTHPLSIHISSSFSCLSYISTVTHYHPPMYTHTQSIYIHSHYHSLLRDKNILKNAHIIWSTFSFLHFSFFSSSSSSYYDINPTDVAY